MTLDAMEEEQPASPRMKPSQPKARRGLSMRFLALGFACTLALAAVTAGIAARETARMEQSTLEIASASQRCTYYLGAVGQRLARLRSHVALGLREPPVDFQRRVELISRIDSELQGALDALPVTLDPTLRGRWAALQPEVSQLRRTYEEAATAIQAGQPARAAALLDRSPSAATKVFDGLEELHGAHREAVLAQLRSMHHELARAVRSALVLGGLFLAGMIAIWSAMMTVLRRQRRQLDEHTARLESVNADLDAFAGRVAHDLKNALGPVVVGPSLLRSSFHDPTRALHITERMDRCSRRAVALVEALLAFSRASHKMEDGESEALPSAVQRVIEELEPEIARLDVTVDVGTMPDVRVRCSGGLLHILLANLLGNAVKFLDGRSTRRVSVGAGRDDSFVWIDIEDTGPGIPREAQEKIFEPFYRVADTRARGTGIGLATVRRVVDQCGGRITVDSTVGKGARFRVRLPLAPPADDERKPGGAHERKRALP